MQSHSTLPAGVRTSRARWPIPNSGVTPMPVRPGSSVRMSVRWSRPSSAMWVHRWPPGGTASRSSSQIGHDGGGCRGVGVLHRAACADPGRHHVTAGCGGGGGGRRRRFPSYMRRSASRSSAAASVCSVAQHPTAAEIVIVEPSTTNGSAAAIRSRRAMDERLVGLGVLTEHRELVASEPGRDVADAQQRDDPGRELGEHRVADGVPEPVVHRLEPVEVEVEQVPQPGVAAAAAERPPAAARRAGSGSPGRSAGRAARGG